MNALLIYRLTRLALPFLFLLKFLRNCEVFFLDMSEAFRDMNKMHSLEDKGIKWVKREYTKFAQYHRSQVLAVEYSEIIYKKVCSSFINHSIEKLLRIEKSQKNKMDIVWKYYINRVINSFAEQYAAGEYLRDTRKYSSITIVSFNSLAYFLKGLIDDRSIKTIILPGLYFYKGFGMFYSSACMALRKVKSLLSMTEKSETSNSPLYQRTNLQRKIDFEKCKVVYFPHQGIYYGEMFKKGHFYSENSESPFYRSNILHLSLGEQVDNYMLASYKYYMENDIPYSDLYELDYSKGDLIKSLLELLGRMNFRLFSDFYRFGFWYIFLSLYLFLRIKRYYLVLSKFKNLRVALAGYDWLFPRELAMALTLKNVRICANEERFIIAFFPDNYLIFDYYFVASNIVKEPCMKTSMVDNFIPVGLVRVDTLHEYEKKQLYDEKYDEIKKTKKLILALDYILPPDRIADVNWSAAKISETRQFYKDLIKLAKDFPSFYIVIKGKGLDSYSSHFIKDILLEIDQLDNIKIEIDLKRYNPHFISEKADLTIACYTSLCDELLAAGRKVIIYEITDSLDTLFLDYIKHPIIARNYNELKYHVENFINGIYLDNDTMKRIQKEFYSDCFHGKVKRNIQSILEEIVYNWPNDKINNVFSEDNL